MEESDQSVQPKIDIPFKPKLFNTKITVLGIAILAVALLILNYLNILPLSKLYPKLAPKQSQTAQKTPPLQLIFSCPVATKSLCQSSKPIQFDGNPALSFLLPGKTEVISVIPANSTTQLQGKQVVDGFLFENNCYAIAYTFPANVTLANKNTLPLLRGRTIAQIGTSSLTVNGEKVNFILQLQKKPASQTASCDVKGNNASAFGQYQQIDISMFK